ncbi:hypothetical protein PMAG_b0620 [Pseudoalteromonas mariniglutinosa NCIMB 1770]|nr:hypothetical protein [Pseudoalteromonas mariniglutinosa NCIMB 1770]
MPDFSHREMSAMKTKNTRYVLMVATAYPSLNIIFTQVKASL